VVNLRAYAADTAVVTTDLVIAKLTKALSRPSPQTNQADSWTV
jgi:hypothetical protein